MGRVAPPQLRGHSPWVRVWEVDGTLPADPEAPDPRFELVGRSNTHAVLRVRGGLGPDTVVRLDQSGGRLHAKMCYRVGIRSVLAHWLSPFLGWPRWVRPLRRLRRAIVGS